MNDLLNWYLHPRSKLARGRFNIILLVAFIPVLFLQFQQMQIMMAEFDRMLMHSQSMEELSQQYAQQMMHMMSSTVASPSYILEMIIYALLVPIIMMRLRDMGQTKVRALTAITYGHIMVGILMQVFGLPLPNIITWLAGITSFVMFSWICTAKSKEATTTHE